VSGPAGTAYPISVDRDSTAGTAGVPGTAGVLRVVTLNAASLIEPGWSERRYEILAWLERLDPDVVCLQEVWEAPGDQNTAGWLADHAEAGRWHWVFGGYPMPAQLWPDSSVLFGSAVLSRWPIDHYGCFALPIDERVDVPHPVFRLHAELVHARTCGIDVFSTHLAPPPTQGAQRVQQVLAIDAHITSERDPAAVLPPVLCGDFNAEPDSEEIRFLSSLVSIEGRSTYYQEAWRAAGNTGAGFTNDHRSNPLLARLNVPVKRIDYIFVGDAFLRPGGAGLVVDAQLVFDQPLTGTLASDHFGVLADIRWPQRPA
jgi:endonuclease/exonuclease/phosphatase family metal-dependent hydrolase